MFFESPVISWGPAEKLFYKSLKLQIPSRGSRVLVASGTAPERDVLMSEFSNIAFIPGKQYGFQGQYNMSVVLLVLCCHP